MLREPLGASRTRENSGPTISTRAPAARAESSGSPADVQAGQDEPLDRPDAAAEEPARVGARNPARRMSDSTLALLVAAAVIVPQIRRRYTAFRARSRRQAWIRRSPSQRILARRDMRAEVSGVTLRAFLVALRIRNTRSWISSVSDS